MGVSGDVKKTQLKSIKTIKSNIQEGKYNNKIC